VSPKNKMPTRFFNKASLTLAAMSLGYGVVQLDVTIVNVAVNSIGASFGGNMDALQWVVSSYTIAFAAFILSAGALGDRIGAKRVFIVGFAIFTLASLACALAPSLLILIAARGVQGLGAAILVPNSLALLNHAYTDSQARSRAVGLWAAGASVALTMGPLVGGVLIELFGWRSIFLVNLPLGLIGLLLAAKYAEETPRDASRAVDAPGQVTAVLALGLLAAVLIEGGRAGWSNPWVISGFGVAAATGLLFLLVEHYSTHPMLPLGMFKQHTFRATTVTGLLVNIAFYGLIFVFSLYFQRVHRMTPLWTGLAFVPMTGACLVANLFTRHLSGRIGDRKTIVIGTTLMMLACIAMLGINEKTDYALLLFTFIVSGAGLGLLVPPLTHALLGSVDKARSGIASGVLNASRQTGSVLGVSLFGSFIALPSQMIRGTRIALAMSAIILLIAGVIELVGMARKENGDD
jgi:DHA2 family methylenomycin A resistance protein-like MFS transporter